MDLKSLLIFEEGLRLKPYKCSEGKWTIGVGHNIDNVLSSVFDKMKKGISENYAYEMLEKDINDANKAAQKYSWFKDLNEPRQAVIISMIFQLGEAGFAEFKKTIGFISKGNFQAAATEMLDSMWAKQTPGRAHRHIRQMATGEWYKEYLKEFKQV